MRRARRSLRRVKVARLMLERCPEGPRSRMYAAIARQLGVHRSTISRDVAALLAWTNEGRPCPVCGTVVEMDLVRLSYLEEHPERQAAMLGQEE